MAKGETQKTWADTDFRVMGLIPAGPWYPNDFRGADMTPGGELRLRIAMDDTDVLIYRFGEYGLHVWTIRFDEAVPESIIRAALTEALADVAKEA